MITIKIIVTLNHELDQMNEKHYERSINDVEKRACCY